MKHGPVTKLDKINKSTTKKFADDAMFANFNVIIIFPIYDQFGAIRTPDSGRAVCKAFSLIVTFYHSKTENRTKKSLTQLSRYSFEWRCYFCPKMLTFCKKILTSTKLRGPWHYKVNFLRLNMCMYLRITFQVSSLILTRERDRGGGGGVTFSRPLIT